MLLEPHMQQTVERIQSCNADYILAIQDSMVLNYTTHKAKTEIGRIGSIGKKGAPGKRDQYGLIQHSTLCVTNTNECLGLMDIQHFHNDDFDTSIDSEKRPIDAKKSRCWIKALKKLREQIGLSTKKIITVADRESDFFEFLHEMVEHKALFVIRLKHDRNVADDCNAAEKLSDLLEKQEVSGEIGVVINDVATREIKEIQLKIKCLKQIELPVPRWAGYKKNTSYKSIFVNVVMAYNDHYCWIILTNLDVSNLSACIEVVNIYKQRWHIEDYHKILKTAYQADELYLHSSRQAIENALTMISISACRLYWLIFTGRIDGTISAEKIFKEHEWKCLYVYFKESIPQDIPRLKDIILKIARLGGYKHTKNAKPPGIKTMWFGFQGFTIAANMFEQALSIKT